MIRPTCIAGVLLAVLGACTQWEEPQHPVERLLSGLQPVTIAPLDSLGWPVGTVLCAMTPYQSEVPGPAAEVERVNAFLKRKGFQGDEGHWSLVVVKPGNDGIEHLVFRNGNNEIVNEPDRLAQAAQAVPGNFQLQACVSVERGRVLVARGRSPGRVIAFGAKRIDPAARAGTRLRVQAARAASAG